MLHNLQIPSERRIFLSLISVLMWPWNILQLKSSDFLWQSLPMCITLNHLSKFMFSSGYLDIQYSMDFSCNSELNMKMWYISLADNSDKHFSMPPGILNFISSEFLGAQFWTVCTWCFSLSQLGKIDFLSFSYSNINALLFINLLCMKVASREELWTTSWPLSFHILPNVYISRTSR